MWWHLIFFKYLFILMCQTLNSSSQTCWGKKKKQCHRITISCSVGTPIFSLYVCAHLCMPHVYVSVTAHHWVALLTLDSGFSESQQLKPNVITVFVKGLDKRLRVGMALHVWYGLGTIVWSFLASSCRQLSHCSFLRTVKDQLTISMRWSDYIVPAFVPQLPTIMTPLSSHSWRGQRTGRRGVKNRSANPHLVKTQPLHASGTCFMF